MLSSRHHVQPYDTLGAATVTIPQAAMPTGCGVSDSGGATKRVIHNIFICINHTCAYGRVAWQN